MSKFPTLVGVAAVDPRVLDRSCWIEAEALDNGAAAMQFRVLATSAPTDSVAAAKVKKRSLAAAGLPIPLTGRKG